MKKGEGKEMKEKRIKEKRKMTGSKKGEGKKRKEGQTDIMERRGHDRHLFYWLLAFSCSNSVTSDSL